MTRSSSLGKAPGSGSGGHQGLVVTGLTLGTAGIAGVVSLVGGGLATAYLPASDIVRDRIAGAEVKVSVASGKRGTDRGQHCSYPPAELKFLTQTLQLAMHPNAQRSRDRVIEPHTFDVDARTFCLIPFGQRAAYAEPRVGG